jgi:malonate transporter
MNMVLSSLFPVFALLIIGRLLGYFHLTSETFLKTSDRLVYFIFFPILLFWKIGGAQTGSALAWDLCLSSLVAIAVVYVVSAFAMKIFRVSSYKAGSFSQSCYRFNTYIGMAIIFYALGDEGIKHFGILVGFSIPFINVLAVSTLIWYSGREFSQGERMKVMLKELVTNPLILSCVAGLLYLKWVNYFPVFIENTFRLSSAVAMPLALISIGGALTLKSLKGNYKLSLVGAVIKLIILPMVGFFCLKMFHVTGIPFRVGIIFFTLPTSASIYVLSSQLNSDTDLASASVVMSTILSFFSLTVGLLL